MITLNILGLASDFIQHAFLIVLVGLVFVELIVHEHNNVLSLLIVAVSATIWLVLEFFVDLTNPWYHMLVHAPIVIGIFIILSRLEWSRDAFLRPLFIGLGIAIVIHLSLDAHLLLADEIHRNTLLRSLLRIIQAFLLFFFVLRYLIISKKR